MSILVTGGCGFIGSNFIRNWSEQSNVLLKKEPIINLDMLTYAGKISNAPKDQKTIVGDIANNDFVNSVLIQYNPRAIVHFAAETHVDNSIANPLPFLHSNVEGTVNLLQCVLEIDPSIIFLHVSTDEVYGTLNKYDAPFYEKTPYAPRSPYAASKAAADHFVNAYHITYGLKTIITNCSNNYGPYQHYEKLIPTIIRKALANEQIPIYGTGDNIRDWIYVRDHCNALNEILNDSNISFGEKYCIGGHTQISNLDLTKKILDLLDLPYDLISFVEDRKGHDFRYDIDSFKISRRFSWEPKMKFNDGLALTVAWYKEVLNG